MLFGPRDGQLGAAYLLVLGETLFWKAQMSINGTTVIFPYWLADIKRLAASSGWLCVSAISDIKRGDPAHEIDGAAQVWSWATQLTSASEPRAKVTVVLLWNWVALIDQRVRVSCKIITRCAIHVAFSAGALLHRSTHTLISYTQSYTSFLRRIQLEPSIRSSLSQYRLHDPHSLRTQ